MRQRVANGQSIPIIEEGEHYHAMHGTLPQLSLITHCDASDASLVVARWTAGAVRFGFKISIRDDCYQVHQLATPEHPDRTVELWIEACTETTCQPCLHIIAALGLRTENLT